MEPDESVWRSLPVGQAVHKHYTALARAVMAHEKACFGRWAEGVGAAAMAYLKQPVLAKDAESGEQGSGKQSHRHGVARCCEGPFAV